MSSDYVVDHNHLSANFFYQTNNSNLLRNEDISANSITKLVDCSTGSQLVNHDNRSDGQLLCSIQEQQQQQQEAQKVAQQNKQEATLEWSLQETADDSQENNSSYLLSLSTTKNGCSSVKPTSTIQEESQIERDIISEHELNLNSSISLKKVDDDQRDPLAKLISSTIGDIMLDIAPAKN